MWLWLEYRRSANVFGLKIVRKKEKLKRYEDECKQVKSEIKLIAPVFIHIDFVLPNHVRWIALRYADGNIYIVTIQFPMVSNKN